MRSEIKLNTLVKSQWKSLVRPKQKSERLPVATASLKRDLFPWSPSGGLVDLSDPFMPTCDNCGDVSKFSELPFNEPHHDSLPQEVSRSSDDSGILLNRWLYADPSELPPPPVPDKIALDTDTCRTLGPPRLNEKDPHAYSPDSGYCSFDSTPRVARPTSQGSGKPSDHRHDLQIDNPDTSFDKLKGFGDNPNLATFEETANSVHDLETAKSPKSELQVSPLSIRSRGASTLQSIVGSQSGSSGTGSSSVDDVDEEFIRTKLNHQLLRSLMEEFYSLLDSILKTSPHGSSTNSSGRASERGTTSSFTNNPFLSQNSNLGKGKDRGKGSEPPEDDEDKDGRRKRSRHGESSGRLYACPFHKYDPRKYSCRVESRSKFRTCAGPGWNSISRLRQHLKRVHSPPLQCRRCWEVFPDEPALERHAQSANPCQRFDREVVEGISKTKFELLDRHRIDWNEMYRIIFPGAPLPQSCYHDSSEPPVDSIQHQSVFSLDLSAYESYARAELPRLVEAMLEGMIKAETEPLEERLKPLLIDVVRSCQSTLSHRWQSFAYTASPSPPLQGSFQETLNPVAEPGFTFQDARPLNPMYPSTVVQSAYQEPPFWHGDTAMSAFEPFDATQLQMLPSIAEQGSESGYASRSQSSNLEYFCQCHQLVDYQQNDSVYASSSNQMPQISKFTSFTSFRPSMADLEGKASSNNHEWDS